MKIVEFNDLEHRFDDDNVVLKDISLSVDKGSLNFITGPSGSGKTTLLNLLLGLYRPTRGEIWVNGANITELSTRQLAHYRQYIGTVFQHNNLVNHRTVFENVAMPLWLRGIQRKEVQLSVLRYLNMVGLGTYQMALPQHLSSGDQQRVAIARALITNPHILVADEPTGNLDRALADYVATLLRQQTQLGTTVIIVTHDESLIRDKDHVNRLGQHPTEDGANTFL